MKITLIFENISQIIIFSKSKQPFNNVKDTSFKKVNGLILFTLPNEIHGCNPISQIHYIKIYKKQDNVNLKNLP